MAGALHAQNESMRFHDRRDAGRQLAARLRTYAHRRDVVVLALPRGGVPVADEVAAALAAPLDLLVVRKLGVPGHEELAMGAIAAGGVRVLSDDVISQLGIPAPMVEQVSVREHLELERRERLFRGDRPFPDVRDRVVIIVDDGLATGATVEAAVAAVTARHPAKIVIAAPVGAAATVVRLKRIADEVVCVEIRDDFYAVGAWYERFDQLSDEDVVTLLRRGAGEHRDARPSSQEDSMSSREIPRDRWRQELDSFSREHEGWLVRVDVTDSSGQTRTEARDLPLQGVSADSPRNNAVAIIIGDKPADHVTHEVPDPVNIAIDQSAAGAEHAIRIKGSDGSTTTVEFRSPTHRG